MPQNWINTIPFGSGHTLGTFNHGLEPLFCCFITHFGVGSSLVAPGAPWCPPGTPLTPGMSSLAIHNHPGSLWVIFDPSGVSNWGVSLLCIAVQFCVFLCLCNFLRFLGVFGFFVWFGLISSYLGPLNTENITWIQNGVIWFRPTSCTHFATFQHITPCYKKSILGSKQPVSGNLFFCRFSLRLSENNRSRVKFIAKFGPTASNFGYIIFPIFG